MSTWENLKQRLNEIAREEGKEEKFEVMPDQENVDLEVVYDHFGKKVRKTIRQAEADALLQPERKHDLEQFAASSFS